jgi:hypothetical protein
MKNAYNLCGAAAVLKKLKIGASIAQGVLTLENAAGGLLPCTTTSAAGSYGLALDTGTYSTTQGDDEGTVTCNIQPHEVIRARISGGAAEGTDMTTLVNTSQSTGGTVVSDADVGSADMDSGTVWRKVKGGQSDESRIITTHTGSASFTVTVPFLQSIEVGDEFLWSPYSIGNDGSGNVQTSTAFTEANGAIASGTGQVANVIEVLTYEENNSSVDFLTGDHALNYTVT